jgi:hypothetical protein
MAKKWRLISLPWFSWKVEGKKMAARTSVSKETYPWEEVLLFLGKIGIHVLAAAHKLKSHNAKAEHICFWRQLPLQCKLRRDIASAATPTLPKQSSLCSQLQFSTTLQKLQGDKRTGQWSVVIPCSRHEGVHLAGIVLVEPSKAEVSNLRLKHFIKKDGSGFDVGVYQPRLRFVVEVR